MTSGDQERQIRVLVVAPFGRDGGLTEKALGAAGISVCLCADAPALVHEMERGVGALLLTEEALVSTLVGALGAALAVQAPWSDLPIVIVTTKRPDDRQSRAQFERLMALGNVTLLERPLSPRSLVSAMASALRARRRQYEGRDLLSRIEHEVARRDQFLAMLGHELRNPLGAIRNVTEILQRLIPAAERTDRQLAILLRQTRHLTRMVDDLLEVSRVSAGKLKLQRVRLALGPLVEAVVQQLAPAAKQQRLELSYRDAGRPLFVDGDPVRLEQILGNLLTNAIKYTPAGGRVDVVVDELDGRARVSIRDTGVGISAEALPFVFELFSQVERTLDRAQGGMGIGLTLARNLIKLHGGEIQATSRGLGLGAEFVVTLPRYETGPSAPATAGAAALETSPRRRVLVVDDSVDNRESLRELLESLGHEAAIAEDGLQALDRIGALPPEVAIIDIGLPGLDGYEVARRTRAAHGASIYLVALTGYGQQEDVQRAYAAGFDAHVTKPADLRALQALLERQPRAAGA